MVWEVLFTRAEPAWTRFVMLTGGFLNAHHAATPAATVRLTPRQKDMLAEIARGKTDRQISRALELSARTDGNHGREDTG